MSTQPIDEIPDTTAYDQTLPDGTKITTALLCPNDHTNLAIAKLKKGTKWADKLKCPTCKQDIFFGDMDYTWVPDNA